MNTTNGTRFSIVLSEALRAHEVSQTRLAELLGTTQSTVSLWATGKAVPDPHTVFDIEEVLGLRPGQLSRVLGFLPVASEKAPIDIEDCISQLDLDVESKRMLVIVARNTINNYRKLQSRESVDA